MVAAAPMTGLSLLFQRSFPSRTVVNVLPQPGNQVALAAGMAGMKVVALAAAEWPFPALFGRLSDGQLLSPTLVGRAEIDAHNVVRDRLADEINAAPGGAAITEVALTATLTQTRADADIIARSPPVPGYAGQAFFEVKTGPFSEIRMNQRYIYALALLGGHIRSSNPKLPKVGLKPGVPLPAMDFILVSADPPGYNPAYALIRAAQVDRAASLALIMGEIAIIEAAP